MKKLILALAVLVIGILGAGALYASKTSANVLRYCNGNSVIRCGAYGQSELNTRMNSGENPDARGAYAHFGIPTDLSQAVQGTVKKNGTVVVNGNVVATGVKSMGRQNYTSDSQPLKIGSTTFYTRSVTNSLDGDHDAYVFLDGNGEFKGAIMKACGNPSWGDSVKPSYQCKALTVTQKSRTEFAFVASHAESNATLVKTTYVVTDASGNVVQDSTDNSFSTSKVGTYTVKAVLTYNVNGVIKTVTGDCIKQFTVEAKPIQVCDLDTDKIITIKETDFNSKKHVKMPTDQCEDIEVCIIADKTGEMITIKRHELDLSVHSTDVEDCKEVPVPPTPEQPLPVTGPAGVIGVFTGISALGAGGYHLFQRRRLNK